MEEGKKEVRTGGLYRNVKMSVKTADIIIAVGITLLLAIIVVCAFL